MVPVERWAGVLRSMALEILGEIPNATRPQKLRNTHDDLLILAARLERLAILEAIDQMQAREDQVRAQRQQLEANLAQRPDV